MSEEHNIDNSGEKTNAYAKESKRQIKLPAGASDIIQKLERSGYEAYIVGGCVRDVLLGRTPHDWDICTSATPSEMKVALNGMKTYDTGIKHGTLTVNGNDKEMYEVTTFRTDGKYSDGRHPDNVSFVRSLREDIMRRDFTMNALAYNKKTGVVDLVGGMEDIRAGRIRCVGVPEDRFNEDGLRILRALRFASVYEFKIESETAKAVHECRGLLDRIARERVTVELLKLLHGKGRLGILMEYSDIIAQIIPEMKPCIGFEQNNPYHKYDVYEHIMQSVDRYQGDDDKILLALLLHDIGKPSCYSEDERGGHFYGHAAVSAEMADTVLRTLRVDNATRTEAVELIKAHDMSFPKTKSATRRMLAKLGEDRFHRLMDVRLADIEAHSEYSRETTVRHRRECIVMAEEILNEEKCFSVKDLEIDGNDVMRTLNIRPGKSVGNVLKTLLDEVLAGKITNDKDVLVKRAATVYEECR